MRHSLNNPVSSTWLAERLGLDHAGPAADVAAVAPLGEASRSDLSFATRAIAHSEAILIRTQGEDIGAGSAILAANPRLAFVRALLLLDANTGFVHDTSEPEIDPTATIGSGVVIEAGVCVGPGSRIGRGVVLHAGTRVGRNCSVGANAVIGGTSFGFERDERGCPVPFLHLGRVVLADDVEIGSLTAIDRGTLGDTMIGARSKIDNLVHIAHNVQIGEDCMVTAGAEISGGVRFGDRSWIGPNACVIDGVALREDVVIGIGAAVLNPVPAGQTVAGNPAEEMALLTRKRAAVKALLD